MAKNKKTEQTQEEEIPEIESDADETARDDSDAMGDLLAKLSELKKLADSEKSRADDMTNVATRLRADFDNYRKRNADSAAKEREAGRVEVIEKFIHQLLARPHHSGEQFSRTPLHGAQHRPVQPRPRPAAPAQRGRNRLQGALPEGRGGLRRRHVGRPQHRRRAGRHL